MFGQITRVRNRSARLYISYLKGKSELLLHVNASGTTGSRMIYRRSPSDAAINLRIESLLEHAQVLRSQVEIWIMLYPPEIITCTLYTDSSLNPNELHEQIREYVSGHLPYSVNYDWKSYLTRIRENGDGQNMVTVTLVGRSVLPRIKALLYRNFRKVTFIGDGCQFLSVDEASFPHTRGRVYQVILPYDEIYYLAGFRSGIHVSSHALTHANSCFFGRYRLDHQQAYLDCRPEKSSIDWPRIIPIADANAWHAEYLTPAAFPAWHIARNAFRAQTLVNLLAVDRPAGENRERGTPIHRKWINPY